MALLFPAGGVMHFLAQHRIVERDREREHREFERKRKRNLPLNDPLVESPAAADSVVQPDPDGLDDLPPA